MPKRRVCEMLWWGWWGLRRLVKSSRNGRCWVVCCLWCVGTWNLLLLACYVGVQKTISDWLKFDSFTHSWLKMWGSHGFSNPDTRHFYKKTSSLPNERHYHTVVLIEIYLDASCWNRHKHSFSSPRTTNLKDWKEGLPYVYSSRI